MRAYPVDFAWPLSHIRARERKGRRWMEFTQSGPEIVRSEHQRWLLDHWASSRGDALLPVWRGLNADEIKVPFDNLALSQVIGEYDNARFKLEFHGWRLAKSFGEMECVGMFIDDILPPPYRQAAMATYREATERKVPVYTVADMRDPGGRIVHHERLILPFTVDGSSTGKILAAIEAHSPEGPFEIHELMKAPIRPPVIALCTTIQF
jgi:hypothetical protein